MYVIISKTKNAYKPSICVNFVDTLCVQQILKFRLTGSQVKWKFASDVVRKNARKVNNITNSMFLKYVER